MKLKNHAKAKKYCRKCAKISPKSKYQKQNSRQEQHMRVTETMIIATRNHRKGELVKQISVEAGVIVVRSSTIIVKDQNSKHKQTISEPDQEKTTIEVHKFIAEYREEIRASVSMYRKHKQNNEECKKDSKKTHGDGI